MSCRRNLFNVTNQVQARRNYGVAARNAAEQARARRLRLLRSRARQETMNRGFTLFQNKWRNRRHKKRMIASVGASDFGFFMNKRFKK